MDPATAQAATQGCAEVRVCIPVANLTQPFRERVRNLQRGETATFQTILRDTRRNLLSNVRQLLLNKGSASKDQLLDCFMRIYQDCQGSFQGLPTDGRRWLNLAKIRVLELMTLDAANTNAANGLGVEGVVAYAKEGIEEAKNLIRNSSDAPPPPPPPPPQLDSAWEKCLAYTFVCAGQCAATGSAPSDSPATPACDPDLIATEALSKDLDNVLALSGTHVPSVTMGLRYVQTLRETALVKLIRAYGQNFGDYRALHQASSEELAACGGNAPVWDFVRAEASHAFREEDRLAHEITSSPGYRLQAARASADVVRNLFRREYFRQHQRRYQNGGVSFPAAIGMTSHYLADPDCPCMRDKLRITTSDIGRDGVFQSKSMLRAIDSCTPTCCGPEGPDSSVVSLPGGTNGSCAAWTTFPVKQREAAEAEVRRSLRTFPVLASGGSNLDGIFDWESPVRTFPKVARLFHAFYSEGSRPGVTGATGLTAATGPMGSDSSYDPAFPDRGTRTGDATGLTEAYESALGAMGRDFAGAVSRFCKSPSDGGLNWNELVTLPDLAADVVAKQPMYAPIQECGKKAAEGNSALRTGATAVAGLGCLVLGVASAGIAVPACGAMFTGLALADYQDASRRSFLLGRCASAGADAGVCSASDAVEAENERIMAGYMAAAAAAFTAVDVAVVGPQVLARARESYRRIQQARSLLSRESLARLTAELDAAKAAGGPAATARSLETIASEADELAAVSRQATRVSEGVAAFRTIPAEERAAARARLLERLTGRAGSGARSKFPCLF